MYEPKGMILITLLCGKVEPFFDNIKTDSTRNDIYPDEKNKILVAR